MFFRNLTLFRFDSAVSEAVRERLESAMQALPLRDLQALEVESVGFESPVKEGGAMGHIVGGSMLICAATLTKSIPSSVVAKSLAERVKALQDREARKVGSRERKRLKEDVLAELIPRAFAKPSRTYAYLDLEKGWLCVDTASRKTAERVVSLIRQALGSFPALPPVPAESPAQVLNDWLAHKNPAQPLALGDECELREPTEGGARARVSRQDLASHDVLEHLKAGKQVVKLGLVHDERISFVLDDDLVVRKLSFLDVVREALDEASHETTEDLIDAQFALMSLELRKLYAGLIDWFGLAERE